MVALLELDDAIKRIEGLNPRLVQVIECRYFAGLSVDDTAEALGMTKRTVQRDALTCSWLLATRNGDEQGMTDDRAQVIDRIYSAALELPADERDAFIDNECADDELRHEVRELLDAALTVPDDFDARYAGVRDRLWADVVRDKTPPAEDLAGERFDNWRIDERLARGGLATVYLAHRDDGEFDQRVAVQSTAPWSRYRRCRGALSRRAADFVDSRSSINRKRFSMVVRYPTAGHIWYSSS